MLGPRRVLDLFASYYDDPEDVAGLLDLVSLTRVSATPWRHLSGGEQQRLSLALALVGRPEVVFLDEPTAGVDPEGRLSVRDVVAGLAGRGVCVVLTTHELAEAERMADRVVIVRRGRAVAQGTPAALAAGEGGGGHGLLRRPGRPRRGRPRRRARGGRHRGTCPAATGSPPPPPRRSRRAWPPGWPGATPPSPTCAPAGRSRRPTWRRSANRPRTARTARPTEDPEAER